MSACCVTPALQGTRTEVQPSEDHMELESEGQSYTVTRWLSLSCPFVCCAMEGAAATLHCAVIVHQLIPYHACTTPPRDAPNAEMPLLRMTPALPKT
jgi:hypothetical protein